MKISYEQLQNAADNGGNFVENMANAAKTNVCQKYHQYKDWYYNNINLTSPPGALLEQFWNNVCPLEPPYTPPPPPSPSFTGGQCCNLTYRVRVRATNNGGASYFEVLLEGYYTGKILGIKQNKVSDSTGVIRINHDLEWQSCNGTIRKENVGQSNNDGQVNIVVKEVFTAYGQPDTCGNPPSGELPPPVTPPQEIDDIIPVNDINIPIKINPKIQLPGVNVNVFAPIFKPEFNASLNPQFNLNPEFNLNPTVNFNFGMDGVDIDFGLPGGSPPNSLPPNVVNNIKNIVNNTETINDTVNNTKNDIQIIRDSLACHPCEKLEEIKKKLDYQPVYRSFSTGEIQSITRDNLFNLGYLEIDITQLPNSNKIIFGGNADNVMYTGWLTWRMNGYNFERVQIGTEKSVYWSPKWANGFSICCTHNSLANCVYYIEIKE